MSSQDQSSLIKKFKIKVDELKDTIIFILMMIILKFQMQITIIKKEILNLEKKFGFLKDLKLLNEIIGSPP